MNKILFSLLFLASVASAHPVTPDLSKVGRGDLVPRTELGLVIGPPNQALIEAATRLRAFTKATGFEGCAQVCEAPDGRWAFPLRTNFSQVSCQTVAAFPGTAEIIIDCPVGFTRSARARGIHSHPETQEVRANPVDALRTGVRRGKLLKVFPDSFSSGDKKHGPGGYLVAMGQLLYLGENDMITRLGAIGTELPASLESNRWESPQLLASVATQTSETLAVTVDAPVPAVACGRIALSPLQDVTAGFAIPVWTWNGIVSR